MRLPLLIGANSQTLESPSVPIPEGKYVIYTQGLHDTMFDIVHGSNRQRLTDGMSIEGDRSISLCRTRQGTEQGNSICVFVESIEEESYKPENL